MNALQNEWKGLTLGHIIMQFQNTWDKQKLKASVEEKKVTYRG